MGLFSNIFSKNKLNEPIQNLNTEVSGNDIIIAGEMIKENEPVKEDPSVYYVLFANKISGFKGVPFYTRMLLVNDNPTNNLSIYYEIENEIKNEIISREKIQEVQLNSRIQVENQNNDNDYKLIDKNLTKNALFGGQPLSQYLKEKEELETVSNKNDLNSYYELSITFINLENEIQKVMFRVDKNCDKFVNFLKSCVGKK